MGPVCSGAGFVRSVLVGRWGAFGGGRPGGGRGGSFRLFLAWEVSTQHGALVF